MKRSRRRLDPPPVMPRMCATCPWRPGSPYAYLLPYLSESAQTTTRICHSTGSNGVNHRTGKKPHVCRGSRDQQLAVMHAAGIIAAPTDEAWTAAVQAINETL